MLNYQQYLKYTGKKYLKIKTEKAAITDQETLKEVIDCLGVGDRLKKKFPSTDCWENQCNKILRDLMKS